MFDRDHRAAVIAGHVDHRRHRAERDDHDRAVLGAQPDRAHRQAFHHARLIADLHHVADLHGVLQQQEHAGDDVLHQLLRAEADRHADDAGAGQQRGDVHADLAQHHQPGDDRDGDRQRGADQRHQRPQPGRARRLRLPPQRVQMHLDGDVDAFPHREGEHDRHQRACTNPETTRWPTSLVSSQFRPPSP